MSREHAPAEISANPAKPTQTQSQCDWNLDAMARLVRLNQPLPRSVTVGGEEIATSAFLHLFKFDRRPASGALQQIAPQSIGAAQTNEVAAAMGFYLEEQALAEKSKPKH